MPVWVEPLRIVGTIGVWIVLPLQLWAMWRSYRYFRKWEREENAAFKKWMADMDELARKHAQVDQLKAELTMALAETRQRGRSACSSGPSALRSSHHTRVDDARP